MTLIRVAEAGICNRSHPVVDRVSALMQVHYLSGPINVKDAEGKLAQPGDLLAVELCQLGPLPGAYKFCNYNLSSKILKCTASCTCPMLASNTDAGCFQVSTKTCH